MPVERLGKAQGVTPAIHNSIAWRYMDVAKFLDLVLNSELWFSASSSFEDKYETSLPLAVAQRLNGEGLSETKLREFEKNYSEFRESTFVNCWSLSPDESYALWKIYLGGQGSGVAIRSTVSRIRKALSTGDRMVFDGKVKYSKFESELLSLDQMVMTKLPAYKYESEYRLFYVHSNLERIQGEGLLSSLAFTAQEKNRFNVDLAVLVDRIVISPFSPSWLSGVITQVVNEFAPFLADRIENSAIEFTER